MGSRRSREFIQIWSSQEDHVVTKHAVFSFERTSGEWKASLQALFVDVRASAEILRERVKAGIAQARARGQPHGRPPTVRARSAEIKRLFARGLSKREIAKRLNVGRTSVRRVLTQKGPRP